MPDLGSFFLCPNLRAHARRVLEGSAKPLPSYRFKFVELDGEPGCDGWLPEEADVGDTLPVGINALEARRRNLIDSAKSEERGDFVIGVVVDEVEGIPELDIGTIPCERGKVLCDATRGID